MKQRMQSSDIAPCHRHMVFATTLSSEVGEGSAETAIWIPHNDKNIALTLSMHTSCGLPCSMALAIPILPVVPVLPCGRLAAFRSVGRGQGSGVAMFLVHHDRRTSVL